jgi:hypothetical protein
LEPPFFLDRSFLGPGAGCVATSAAAPSSPPVVVACSTPRKIDTPRYIYALEYKQVPPAASEKDRRTLRLLLLWPIHDLVSSGLPYVPPIAATSLQDGDGLVASLTTAIGSRLGVLRLMVLRRLGLLAGRRLLALALALALTSMLRLIGPGVMLRASITTATLRARSTPKIEDRGGRDVLLPTQIRAPEVRRK